MTAAAAYVPPKPHLNQHGRKPAYQAVLAVDGRITDEHGTIYTDRAVKFCQAGNLVCVFAGDSDAFTTAIRRLTDKPVRSAKAMARQLQVKGTDASGWTALVYDIEAESLHTVDSDGTVLREYKHAAAIGTGSEVAMGYLLAKNSEQVKPWGAGTAKNNVRGAIKAASERNNTVGPRCTVLTVGPTGKVSVKG